MLKNLPRLFRFQAKFFSSLNPPSFANLDPKGLSNENVHTVQNYVNGQWKDSQDLQKIIDPMNGEQFILTPETKKEEEIQEFITSLLKCSKSGLHNPIKNVERYTIYGEVCHRAASLLHQPDVLTFFSDLIQRVMPKSFIQARAEVIVVRKFLENFSGDQPRFLCRSFNVAGDHLGQTSSGYRWPYGSSIIISPFNFPLEIPALQLLGALITGNKVLIKSDNRVSIVMEQFIRMLLYCGAPSKDFDYINCDGLVMENIVKRSDPRMLQFTGSSKIANRLAEVTKGKLKIEDAGFDWKILGPDVSEFDYVAWTCDQDAYSMSGQKCSAQSILFAHENWAKKGIFEKMKELASRRTLKDYTNVPVLSWSNEKIKEHISKILEIPESKIAFGGTELKNHKIPKCYGSFEPTAIYVPLKQILSKEYNHLVTTELFGPFQILTSYGDRDIESLLSILEKMENHLTAAVVSNDVLFLDKILGNTINGTTYAGIRGRTTGAPQNHWFGPCGDPRGSGIGTPEAILNTWTCHREIVRDFGPLKKDWTIPEPS